MNVFGIDVSRWQGDFSFEKALQEGVKYVIIKAGGADDGLYKDPRFEENYKKAKAAGLGVGAYFFGCAKTIAEAQREASYFSGLLKGKQFDYPVFYDVEADDMKVGKDGLTAVVWEFCTAMENYGYWCGFYTNWDWYNHNLDGKSLAERFSFWLAFWGASCPDCPAQVWQFGGSTNFIRSNEVAGVVCDQDYCFVDYPALIKQKGKNGYGKTPAPVPAPKPAPAVWTPKVGDKVRIEKDAPVYGYSAKFAYWVYRTVYTLIELNGDRAVFGTDGITVGAVDKKYLKKA